MPSVQCFDQFPDLGHIRDAHIEAMRRGLEPVEWRTRSEADLMAFYLPRLHIGFVDRPSFMERPRFLGVMVVFDDEMPPGVLELIALPERGE